MKRVQGPAGLCAWSVTVGSKGQIVIPKEAREMFHIEPGATLLLLGDPVRGIAIPPQDEVAALHARVFGGKGADAHGDA